MFKVPLVKKFRKKMADISTALGRAYARVLFKIIEIENTTKHVNSRNFKPALILIARDVISQADTTEEIAITNPKFV
jgi:hypothetical protein